MVRYRRDRRTICTAGTARTSDELVHISRELPQPLLTAIPTDTYTSSCCESTPGLTRCSCTVSDAYCVQTSNRQMHTAMSNSLPIMAKPNILPSRPNVNRFSFDVATDQPAFASPATTPDSSTHYGSLTPSPPTNQFSYMPRGLPPFSAPRASLAFGSNPTRYDTPGGGPYPTPSEGDPYYYPAFATPPRPSKKKAAAAKKADGKQPTFLTKLYAILETPEYHHVRPVPTSRQGAIMLTCRSSDGMTMVQSSSSRSPTSWPRRSCRWCTDRAASLPFPGS